MFVSFPINIGCFGNVRSLQFHQNSISGLFNYEIIEKKQTKKYEKKRYKNIASLVEEYETGNTRGFA